MKKIAIFRLLKAGNESYRIVSAHPSFQCLNTGGISGIDNLFDAMERITRIVKEQTDMDVTFEVGYVDHGMHSGKSEETFRKEWLEAMSYKKVTGLDKSFFDDDGMEYCYDENMRKHYTYMEG
jgi:hypothetical protein